MDRGKLISLYPSVFHLANAANWQSIKEHGLLSSESLCKSLLRLSEDETYQIISSHRPTARRERGVTFRDQKPLNESKLLSCLRGSGLTPAQWYFILNQRVFFWTNRDRLNRFLSVYQGEPCKILKVDTAKLVERHGDRIELCHINSGATRMPDHYRSRASFRSISEFHYSSKHVPAELTVLGQVRDIVELLINLVD